MASVVEASLLQGLMISSLLWVGTAIVARLSGSVDWTVHVSQWNATASKCNAFSHDALVNLTPRPLLMDCLVHYQTWPESCVWRKSLP
jgi:hypothetical protein